ncbi:hypothetical protein FA13DRAFT_1620823 [Coprinellus micaceus]|uniref:Uncharacterized protein n=1 Tax=Coprinellus micaceus TaxID=71717 RepID=A0A4Y7TW64_COPMI|nr:hypothetical protein FA13DRAFT_1620823 [Coprinellus micaceus]
MPPTATALDLPAEVLTQIFSLASDEDLLFQYALPTSLANSSWFKHISGEWALRTPQEAGNILMRRSYKTKKASLNLMLVCKQWYSVAYELLFRCLYFNSPLKLFEVVKILDTQTGAAATENSLGWWTRRVHVCRYSAQELGELGIQLEDMQWALLTIIKHCPNLEIFHIDWPMKEAFGEVAVALYKHAQRSLRVVHFNVPRNALKKVIWALNALKFIVAAHIEFESGPKDPDDEEESLNLGSAGQHQLNLKYLYQLSVVGFAKEFLEQALQWPMPSLRVFSYNTGSYTGAVPAVIHDFLKVHGDGLEFLDLDTYLPLEIANILDQCPQVTTFAFNADCRITPHNDVESEIVNRPRSNVHTIGIHGLSLAFGVGAVVAAKNPTIVTITQKSNDLNMAALNKRNFPNLQRIRALSRPMLLDLNRAGQPNEDNGGMARWARWWDTCAGSGVALEDCTGDSLGNLPELPSQDYVGGGGEEGEDSEEYEWDDDEDEDDEDDGDDGDDDDDDDDEEEDNSDDDESSESEDENILPSGWKKLILPMPEENPSARTRELRQLLKECRAMERQRDSEAPLLPPAFMMMMGAGGGMPGFGMPDFPGSDIPTAMGGRGFGFGR